MKKIIAIEHTKRIEENVQEGKQDSNINFLLSGLNLLPTISSLVDRTAAFIATWFEVTNVQQTDALTATLTELTTVESVIEPDSVSIAPITEPVKFKIQGYSDAVSFHIRKGYETILKAQETEGMYRFNTMSAYAKVDSSRLRDFESLSDIQLIRVRLEKDISVAKANYLQQLERDRTQIEGLLKTVLIYSQKLNNLLEFANEEERAQIKDLQKQYEKDLEKLNKAQRKLDSATNNFGITDRKLIYFKAAILKQIDLKELQLSTQNKRKRRKVNAHVLSYLSPAINTQLARFKAILFEEIKAMHTFSNAKTLTSSKTKAINKALAEEMQWADDYVGVVLAQSENWVSRTRYCTFSENGRIFVAVERLSPTADHLTPAGLRAKTSYRLHPTNFQRVESYLMDEWTNPLPGTKVVNYRGGQLPTQEAAYEMLSTLLLNHQLDQKLDALHINVLLTPVRGLAAILKTKGKASKRDDFLLRNHKANILLALRQIKLEISQDTSAKLPAESRSHNGYSVEDIERLISTLTVSNSGVNEGAVGTMKQAGQVLQGGWEESFLHYNNSASEKLNTLIRKRLSSLSSLGDKLPTGKLLAVFHYLGTTANLALDLDQMWASNDFARAEVGLNQFKFPATWAVLDHLLGIVSYTGCMSAKDRTYWVKAVEANMKTTIFAKAELHKAELLRLSNQAIRDEFISKSEFDSVKSVLLSPSFSVADFNAIIAAKIAGSSIQEAVNAQVKVVVSRASTAMNMKAGSTGLLAQKDINKSLLDISLERIPTSISVKFSHVQSSKALALFPNVSPVSIYAYEDDLVIQGLLDDRISLTQDQLDQLEQEHKERMRLRAHMGTSARVTQQNTGVIGTKLENTIPIAQLSSGFNRAYVMYQILKAAAEDKQAQFIELTGLSELPELPELPESDASLSKETQAYFKQAFAKLDGFYLITEKAFFLKNLLEELERAKFEFTKVQAKVSA